MLISKLGNWFRMRLQPCPQQTWCLAGETTDIFRTQMIKRGYVKTNTSVGRKWHKMETGDTSLKSTAGEGFLCLSAYGAKLWHII
jgi:hypothetical protein